VPRDLGPLIDALGLDVDRIPICRACLSFVSIPLGHGEEREARASFSSRSSSHSVPASGLRRCETDLQANC